MYYHSELGNAVRQLIRDGGITLGGHVRCKIYGRLSCKSGKRMRPKHRVFFKDEAEAIAEGYRPCGHCMPEKYKIWKETGKR
jgi:methylphosphotriester-DNA--protein-cysteine methyltransferase